VDVYLAGMIAGALSFIFAKNSKLKKNIAWFKEKSNVSLRQIRLDSYAFSPFINIRALYVNVFGSFISFSKPKRTNSSSSLSG